MQGNGLWTFIYGDGQCKGIVISQQNTEPILETEDGEHPLAVQLFGSEPELLRIWRKKLEEGPYDIIDLNMGCPVPKVVNNHEGSALMKDPILAGKVIEAMAKAVKKACNGEDSPWMG